MQEFLSNYKEIIQINNCRNSYTPNLELHSRGNDYKRYEKLKLTRIM